MEAFYEILIMIPVLVKHLSFNLTELNSALSSNLGYFATSPPKETFLPIIQLLKLLKVYRQILLKHRYTAIDGNRIVFRLHYTPVHDAGVSVSQYFICVKTKCASLHKIRIQLYIRGNVRSLISSRDLGSLVDSISFWRTFFDRLLNLSARMLNVTISVYGNTVASRSFR